MRVAPQFIQRMEFPLVLERLRECFAQTLNREVPPLTEATPFDALPGWDSVVHLSLLLAVEQAFGVAFTSAQMVSMRTVGDMMEGLHD